MVKMNLSYDCHVRQALVAWIWLQSLLLTSLIPVASPILQKKYVNYTGDFILGALFPIHRRGTGSDVCGEIQLEDGVQLLEALLFAVDNVNRDEGILPGIRLGVLALDTCDSGSHAMAQSLDFVKGFLSHRNQYHEMEFQCEGGVPAKFLDGRFDRVVGVIGGQSSSVSIQVASLLQLFEIPQISYMSTSPQLSNREKFPYFFRTVPSDENEAAAIIDILRFFNWTYVAVVYSDSEYGVHCYEALRDFAANDSICFTTPQRIIRYEFQEKDYDQIIRSIVNKPNIRVIILILEKEYMIHIMEAAKRLDVGSNYVWLGTDGWSSRESVVMGKEDILEGAIAIQPLVSRIGGFDKYFQSLTPKHSDINPWFDEFWERYFKCKLSSGNSTGNGSAQGGVGNVECGPDLRISPENGYSQQPFLHFVRDAVYAFAFALNDMHLERCGGVPGVCKDMTHIDGPDLMEFLRKVYFNGEDDYPFRFENGRDGPTRYTIVNFQRGLDGKTYQWQKVGEYSSSVKDGGMFELKIELERMKYRPGQNMSEYPQSTCAKPCSIHQVKVRERDDTCCWQCKNCGRFQIKHDDFHCDDCPLGTAPDSFHSNCLPIPEEYIDHRNPLAMAAMTFSGFGILLALYVLRVFWAYNDTPIIKAAGRELSYVLLFGIILSFSVTFFIVSEPSSFSCGVVRFLLGFCPTLCYAAIVTKTNRIARIFHQKSGPSMPKTKFISPTSQMIIVILLTSVEIFINAFWMWMSPPDATFTYPERGVKLKICKGLDTYSYMIGFVYPLILIGFCTCYAIQTRKCPGGFNETKYIAFTNYTIIIIWLAFVPLYLTSTSNGIRVVTLAISLSLSGLVEMGCLFFPKIYIVLFKPEKNTKEVVMAPNRSSFATLTNSAPVVSTPKLHANGRYASTQHLSPEEVLVSNGSTASDPT